MNAKLARYGGLREAALHEGVNLATFFVGQTVIAFGHMSSVRCGVPREDSPHLAVTRHAQHGKCGRGKGRPQGCSLRSHRRRRLAPLPPPFSPAPMLRHVVYASLLHFGVETAGANQRLTARTRPRASLHPDAPVPLSEVKRVTSVSIVEVSASRTVSTEVGFPTRGSRWNTGDPATRLSRIARLGRAGDRHETRLRCILDQS